MSYVPKLPTDNVNVSKRHPLAELMILVVGAFLIIGAIYFALGMAVDAIAARLPVEYENRMAGLTLPGLDVDEDAQPHPYQHRVDEIFDKLLTSKEPDGREYQIRVMNLFEGDFADTGTDSTHKQPMVNAFALPGGRIIVSCALIEQAASENELAMVLAHELGHFHNRDHLRSMGRGLVLLTLSTLVLGGDSGIGNLVTGSLSLAQTRYSQGQETASDAYGLALLNSAYGHVGGATDFFQRGQANDNALLDFFSTHPASASRVRDIKTMSKRQGYKTQASRPLQIPTTDGQSVCLATD